MSEPNRAGRPPPRALLKLVTRTHVLLNRLTAGRGFNTLGGNEVCFVTMTGARSGRRRTVPLMHVPHGEGVLLVGSQGGAPTDPLWVRNLRANPDIEVRQRGRRMKLRARAVRAEEKIALWPICDAHYPPYAQYRARTTRDIPIFLCEPRA
jgi:deazaflavin-dependent oxidoreductase (nitroreductase family)